MKKKQNTSSRAASARSTLAACSVPRFTGKQWDYLLTSEQEAHKQTMHERNTAMDTIDRHSRIAADAREMMHNGGFGPNSSQLKRIDTILREIAGLPSSPNAEISGRAENGDTTQ